MSAPPPHLMPRAHHYIYAHILLRDTAFTSKPNLPTYGAMGLVGLALKGKLKDNIVEQWTRAGEQLPPPEEPIPADGIDAEFVSLTDHDAALITLPAPERPSEVYYAVVAHHRDKPRMRYFTLERSLPGENGEPTAVVGEWWSNQRGRANYGELPDPGRDSFIARLNEILDGRQQKTGSDLDSPARASETRKKRKRFGLF